MMSISTICEYPPNHSHASFFTSATSLRQTLSNVWVAIGATHWPHLSKSYHSKYCTIKYYGAPKHQYLATGLPSLVTATITPYHKYWYKKKYYKFCCEASSGFKIKLLIWVILFLVVLVQHSITFTSFFFLFVYFMKGKIVPYIPMSWFCEHLGVMFRLGITSYYIL